MNMQIQTPAIKCFNDKYQIKKKISQGTFGVVYEGFDSSLNVPVAIKVEKNSKSKTLDRETHMLTRLQGVQGVPKLYWSGQEQGTNVLIEQLLGNDLGKFFKVLKKFSLKTVLQLADQLLKLIMKIHQRSIVHRDLKPDNIVIGVDKESDKIHLIDFETYVQPFTQLFNSPFQEGKAFIGTARYSSIASHLGYELSSKDDLESLLYILIYFAKGQLPWQSVAQVTSKERTKLIGQKKISTTSKELCKDLPDGFEKALDYLRNLTYKSNPDYHFLINLFKKNAESLLIGYDGIFDWTDTQQKSQIQISSYLSNDSQLNSGQQGTKHIPNQDHQEKDKDKDKDKRICRSSSVEQFHQKRSNSNLLLPPEKVIFSKSDSMLSGSQNSVVLRYNLSINTISEQPEDYAESQHIETPQSVLNNQRVPDLYQSESEEVNLKNIGENETGLPLYLKYQYLKGHAVQSCLERFSFYKLRFSIHNPKK